MSGNDFVPLSSILDAYLQGEIRNVSMPDQPPLQSGYADLDDLLGGIHRSDMLVVGAGTGLGKSSLALNICVNAAKSGHVCGIFSLEMSREQVAMRILVAESGIDSHRLRLGLLSEHEESIIASAVGVLSSLPIYIDDTPSQTTMKMWNNAEQMKQDHGLDFLVVDYLQLVQGKDGLRGYSENRTQETSEIVRSLKAMARDLEVPVLICSQLNRAVENRPGHRPQLSDLRDSGSIGEDADVVMFIYREDRNFTEEEWDQQAPGRPYPRNIAELIVAKHRNGPTGSLHLYFRDTITRFDEIQRYQESVA